MILHLDLSTGASGDKLLGALLELCEQLELASFDDIASKARALLPKVEISRHSVTNGGIAATHITVSEHRGEPEHHHHKSETDVPMHTHSQESDELHTHLHQHNEPHTHSPQQNESHKLDKAQNADAVTSCVSLCEKAGSVILSEAKNPFLAGRVPHFVRQDPSALPQDDISTQPDVSIDKVQTKQSVDRTDTPHRHWQDIRLLIAQAAAENIINEATATMATRIFTRIAKAEAQVHGVEPDEVHFHEVGAADSIIDIVLSSYLINLLNPSAIYATPLALGNGTFICEHGELPVPAPATAEILSKTNVIVYASCHDGELTTPTGAALIAELVTSFAPLPCSRPHATGYGAGSRHLPGAANVVRILAATPAPLAGLEAPEDGVFFVEGITLLSCNLDHLSAEHIAFVCEELLNAGALDVWQEAITMKKGRLGCLLLTLVKPEQTSGFTERIINLTGTLGVRSEYLERAVIPRKELTLNTRYGPVPFKLAQVRLDENQRHWLRPEHDAVARLARERQLNYQELYAELQDFAESHRLSHT